MKMSINIAGQKFGRMLVLTYVGKSKWECLCDCGKKKSVEGYALRHGKTTSCGCWNLEVGRKAHEAAFPNNPAYLVWKGMKSRCYNPKTIQYCNYGGRGITVCDRWRNSFLAFSEDMGPRPSKKHSIHRINNDGPYEKSNCKWATTLEQSYCRTDTRYIEVDGKKYTLPELRNLVPIEEQVPVSNASLRFRMVKAGWGIRQALTTPMVRGQRGKGNGRPIPKRKPVNNYPAVSSCVLAPIQPECS